MRIDRSELRVSAASEEARATQLVEKEIKNADYKMGEGILYGAGIAD